MAVKHTGFVNAAAVADYNNSHYLEIPDFQKTITDLVNRKVSILNRIKTVPATGHPTRYIEQTKIAHNAKFVSPRATNFGGISDTDYGRVEKAAMLKALTSEISFSLFDSDLMKQQNVVKELLNKDSNDMIVDLLKTQNNAIWNGTAPDLDSSSSSDYCGLMTQITDKSTVAVTDGVFATDEIRGKIAQNLANTQWDAMPTALYANPVTIEWINQNERKRTGLLVNDNAKVDLGHGFVVSQIETPAGYLPLIPEPAISVEDGVYRVFGINENLVERHYLTSPTPRVFKMGLSNTLVDDYVAVLFDTVIAKGCDASAHFEIDFTGANTVAPKKASK